MQKAAGGRSRRQEQKQSTVMKIYGFSFKREAIWITAFSFAPLLIALLVAFVVWFLRYSDQRF